MDQLTKSLSRGQSGIDHVLDEMNKAIAKPRAQFKPTVPIIETIDLISYKRMLLFKNGAQNAKLIEAETGVKLHQELDGSVVLLAPNKEKMDAAKEYMKKCVVDLKKLYLQPFLVLKKIILTQFCAKKAILYSFDAPKFGLEIMKIYL